MRYEAPDHTTEYSAEGCVSNSNRYEQTQQMTMGP